MLHCFLDHVALIFANLTWFNVFTTLVCFIAVFATIWAGRVARERKQDDDEPLDGEDELLKFGFQARFKVAKQRLIEKDLTPQQREKEKELESETLNAVYKLLQERTDIFASPTMDDLKEQLSLYRAQ